MRRRDVCGKETLVIMTIIIRCYWEEVIGWHAHRPLMRAWLIALYLTAIWRRPRVRSRILPNKRLTNAVAA